MSNRKRIEEAARPAAEHAEAVVPGWGDGALRLVAEYARKNRTFIIETVRLAAEADGYPMPPHRRAWGGVAIAAKREGIVESIGYEMSTSPDANPTPVTKWRSLVYGDFSA